MWSVIATMAAAAGGKASALDSLETRGRIDEVTVYRGQALVTRFIEVPAGAGLRELVIGELPDQIVPGSLFAESAGGGEVRSVRYRVRPLTQDVRDDVRKIDEQLRDVEDRLRALAGRKQLLAELRTYIGNLEQFAASTAGAELHHGVLNADTLKTLTLFMFERRESLSEQEHQLALAHRDLEERRDVLQRERQVLTGGSTRTAREAVVFVNVVDPRGDAIRLHYLVNGASWSPSFNIRADAGRERVQVDYHASIQQMSGEDWGDVTMTLSTATPSLVAKAPTLSPLTLALASFEERDREKLPPLRKRDELAKAKKEVESRRNLQQQAGVKAAPADGFGAALLLDARFDRELNELATDEQVFDILSSVRAETASTRPRQEGLSVTYRLPARTSLPSRSDQQLVQIARLSLPGDFYHLATPVLTSYVYEEASVVNTSELVLLAGPASAYVEGRFVGQGQVPTVTRGERFTVGLGIDSSLRAERELVDRSESVQGGNRSVKFTYRIALENFGETTRTIRVLDRLPMGKEQEVKCSLVSSELPETADASHAQTERKAGILRWDVDVPARATDLTAKAFTYELKLEYDKAMTVTGLTAVAHAQP